MDYLIERISEEVGNKWTLLFKELKLNSRVRYDIEAKFEKEPDHDLKSKYSCQESLKAWLNQISIKRLEEDEKRQRLVCILHKIPSLRNIAIQIGFEQYKLTPKQQMPVEDFESGDAEAASTSYPNPLNQSLLPIVPSHNLPSFGLDMCTTSNVSRNSPGISSSQHKYVGENVKHREPHGEHIHTTPSCREGAYLTTDAISIGDRGSHLAHFMTDRGEIGTSDVLGSFSTSDSVVPADGTSLLHVCRSCGVISSEVSMIKTVPRSCTPLIDTETDPCDAVIIIQDRYHKYALLDISQRMLRSNWKIFGHGLKLQDDLLDELEQTEKNIHERYYKLLVQFVVLFREKATFRVLRDVLRECGENLAAEILEERLRTRTELVISAIQYDFITNKYL